MRLGSGLHDAAFVGEYDGLDAVAQSELGEHARDVGLDGCAGYDELVGDLVVGEAEGRQVFTATEGVPRER